MHINDSGSHADRPSSILSHLKYTNDDTRNYMSDLREGSRHHNHLSKSPIRNKFSSQVNELEHSQRRYDSMMRNNALKTNRSYL